jgi:hypothetical protein
MHTGRHRYKTHAGIPHGSTVNAGTELEICYLWKHGYTTETVTITLEDESTDEKICLTAWADMGVVGNHSAQTTDELEPIVLSDGGIQFNNHGDDVTYADKMACTKFNVAADTPFLTFIVCTLDNASTSCYLSDSGTEVLQFTSANAHQMKAGGTVSNMTHSAVFTCPTDEKALMVVHRTGTETIKLYRNGLECNGHNNSGTTNDKTFDIENIGAKAGTSNFFDGIIYDILVVHGAKSTDANRILITDYLLAKHGILRAGLL